MKKVSENRRISYIELTEEAIPVLEKISIEIDKINQSFIQGYSHKRYSMYD